MTTTLLLDPDIRDWVVLPLFVIMVAAGLLRHSVSVLLQGSPVKAQAISARSSSLLRQTMKLQTGAAHYMTTWRWQCRKEHAIQTLRQEADWAEAEQTKKSESGDATDNADDPMSAMMNNPMSMMKGNMVFMVQNMVMMQGIQHFFSGFILLKVPFPLTAGFKSMFQRGLGAELPDLEPSYVSSVSWYFLVMYGLRSFLQLVIGDPPLEVREQSSKTMQYGYLPPGRTGQDGAAVAQQLRQEAENLEVFVQPHKSEFDSVEKRVLGAQRYPKKSKLTGPDSHDSLFVNANTGIAKGKGGKKKSN
jgi:hypothetical protein